MTIGGDRTGTWTLATATETKAQRLNEGQLMVAEAAAEAAAVETAGKTTAAAVEWTVMQEETPTKEKRRAKTA